MSSLSLRLLRSPVGWIALTTAALALGFALFTQHAWEDYYITFRASKNLALGHGLVFTPGERVHSFTSPLGVLLPALTSLVAGVDADLAALWLFRGLSALALGGAAALLFASVRRWGGGAWAGAFAVGLLALDAKTLDFSTNGMETGCLMLFLAYAVWALSAVAENPWRQLGVAWAGIMWTRPDGFIYIACLGLGFLGFGATGDQPMGLRARLLFLTRGALVCTVLYLPWFVWAWTYYGSPIPHTITAKSSMGGPKSVLGFLETLALLPVRLWTGQTTVEGTLLPSYYMARAWPLVWVVTARIFGCVAMLAWCWPRLPAPVRAASLAFLGTHAYLSYFPYIPFPWYFPATLFFATVVWGGLAAHLWARASTVRPPAAKFWHVASTAAAIGLIGFHLWLTPRAAVQMAEKQRLVYTGNLQRIGEWLKAHAAPEDRVFMEPLGYIGYFSQLRTLDYPGLSSPRMVEARKSANNWSSLLLDLVPEWAVIRRPEAELMEREKPGVFTSFYVPVQHFDVRAAVAPSPAQDHLMLEFDADFTVYHRRHPIIPEHLILGMQSEFGDRPIPMNYGGAQMLMVHAPGTLGVRVPVAARRVALTFGLLPDAYAGATVTDGATFTVVWADGAVRKTLAVRSIDPVAHENDRGVQHFSVELPESADGRARLLLNTRPGATKIKDWTVWGGLVFD